MTGLVGSTIAPVVEGSCLGRARVSLANPRLEVGFRARLPLAVRDLAADFPATRICCVLSFDPCVFMSRKSGLAVDRSWSLSCDWPR